MKICYGSRRTVFLIGDRAYKIPRFKRFVSFIRGINENLEERYWYSADGSRKRCRSEKWNHKFLAEIFYADRFGLLVVMKRADTKIRPETYAADFLKLSNLTKSFSFHGDMNESNVGYVGNELVFIDYGYFGGTLDCYIGT